jgi:hypothetical protein
MAVAITIHSSQLAKLQRTLGDIKNGVPKALAPAINRALASGKTVVKREIRKEYAIKAKDIPATVYRASYNRLSGQIRIDQGMLHLDKFKVRPTGVARKNKRGIFALVKRGGGGWIKSAFNIPSGGPYARIGPERHPIFKLATISAAIMATQPAVGPEVNKKMGDTLAKRIDHEMNRVLASAGR